MNLERRADLRVRAAGSVLVHAGATSRGRLANLSSGGLLVQLADGEPACARGDEVEVELHLDRAEATWLRFAGRVLRAEHGALAIAFTDVSLEVLAVIAGVLVAADDAASHSHVLVVDADAGRRVPFAARLAHAGCRVVEAATPLEAIAHLGGTAIDDWLVVIADSEPAGIADELRRHLADCLQPVDVVPLGIHASSVGVVRLVPGVRGRRT